MLRNSIATAAGLYAMLPTGCHSDNDIVAANPSQSVTIVVIVRYIS
jgi:hypothetical protein